MNIGQEIKLHRKLKGLTQQGLAIAAGINRQTICKLEKGNYNILLSSFLKILTQIDLKFILYDSGT